jgi:fructose/tagatose bisphosphate aldolase
VDEKQTKYLSYSQELGENPEGRINLTITHETDALVESAVFTDNDSAREKYRQEIRKLASCYGIYPASIQGLYVAAGKGHYSGRTVPAINIRGITYQVARAVFRAALKYRVGAFIFEIARSEIGYTAQKPGEYASCVLAAAIKEGYKGPVFLQGDHFQVNQRRYSSEPQKEIDVIKGLVQEAIGAGFFNIDIDASTLVDFSKKSLEEQQEKNCLVTADMTNLIRSIEPKGTTISIGGEIGEVGKNNSTAADLRAFMAGYLCRLDSHMEGISKISIQTGTTHGGVILPDGSVASVEVDFKALEEISKVARNEYGLAGAVQHGASTLPEEAFDIFPKVDTAEVHLATGFQNLIFDSPYFPEELLSKINKHLLEKYIAEKMPEDTKDQFLYKTRKKAFGDFKKEMWNFPEENMGKIMEMLEERFSLLFQKLGVIDTIGLVNQFVD